MKLLLCLSLVLVICFPSWGTTLVDEFDNSLIDSHWVTRAWDTSSSVLESGTTITFTERGQIETADEFPTSLIEGRARLTGASYDFFAIGLRMSTTDELGGLSLVISEAPLNNYDYNVYVVGYEDGNRHLLATATTAIPMDEYFDFRVVDDGQRVDIYLNSFDNPLISVATDIRVGNKIRFHNRELSGCVGELEYVRVEYEPAEFVADDFEDGVLDLAQWAPSTSYAWSGVIEENGILRLVDTGIVAAVPGFSACKVQAQFRFTGSSWDHFDVILRSDGELGGPYGRTQNGIVVATRPSVNPDAVEVALIDIQAVSLLAAESTPFPILLNQDYEILIEDDGLNITVRIDDQLILSHASEADFGDRVLLANGNKPGYSCVTELEWAEITVLDPVIVAANGERESLMIKRGESLQISAYLSVDGISGDTWILAVTPYRFPFNIYALTLSDGQWKPWLYTWYRPSAQGQIPYMRDSVLMSPDLPPGSYTFYVGYDDVADGRLDFDRLVVDSVSVLIEN